MKFSATLITILAATTLAAPISLESQINAANDLIPVAKAAAAGGGGARVSSSSSGSSGSSGSSFLGNAANTVGIFAGGTTIYNFFHDLFHKDSTN
ncbi:unnamed protein product [Ambrosiozyma monospora]|uniref:Unnamed protein product n=1 Tax=Ambrosiozyma monospora TaxID=43982 RepID=A0ACB5UBG5_AMBMO|nr:unnamed protein product [Ambrosiozyma monospora]